MAKPVIVAGLLLVGKASVLSGFRQINVRLL